MKRLLELIEREEKRDGTEVINGYYGKRLKNTKYRKLLSIIKGEATFINIFNEVFNGLYEEQIDELEGKYNNFNHCNVKFPEWYMSFLKEHNGFDIYSGALIIYGDDLVNNRLPGAEASDPLDFGPESAIFTGEAFYDKKLQERWLFLGRYNYDGTSMAWDFKLNKLVIMEPDPNAKFITKKQWMSVTEEKVEKRIIGDYPSFIEYVESEIERIENIFNNSLDDDIRTFHRKCLPSYCKNHLD